MGTIHDFFTSQLLEWYKPTQRPLPWKSEKNPYYIWLSEIILQQTRVEQGRAYYEKFKKNYPTVQDLANAGEDQVLKNWQGLGYYSRARNLHQAAKYIVSDLGGKFPATHEDILKLKGVGEYTAAAIASFAYDLPFAVLDGNVFRVLSRFFGIKTPIDTGEGKKEFKKLAQKLLPPLEAARYNQAIMDFGATICMPKKPKCVSCPFRSECSAFINKNITFLPIKAKKTFKKERFFHYLRLNIGDFVYLHKRSEKDIWQHLYEFPLYEADRILDVETVKNKAFDGLLEGVNIVIKRQSKVYKQVLSHQKISAIFMEFELLDALVDRNNNWIQIKKERLKEYAFPKIIDLYLNDNSLYLNLF